MAEINKINVGGEDYDIRDTSKLPKVTYEWNKEFAAGENGAISLGRYNMYDTQLTFDITSTTTQSLSGKLVIATQNGNLCQAKVFGDASGTLVSKLIIYQSAISGSRSWIEVFCNFDGWSKNKVHIYAVALNSATVEKQMTSVTISSGTPATANVTKGDKKWTGTIINDSSHSHSHDVSIAASSGTNELTLAHGTKYALTAGGQSFVFTMPSDTNTWRPVGTGATDAAAGNHTHDGRYIATGQTEALTVTNGAQTLAYGTTKTIASVAGTDITVTMPTAVVAQTRSTTSGNYALLMSRQYTATSTTANNSGGDYGCRWNTNLYANPSSGQITATAFYASSDSRLKENIKDYTPDNSILDLPIVEFDFKDSKSHQIGCIAQNLQNLFPELVNTNEDGYLSIAENKLVYLCILEIKKLKAELEALKMSKE